MRVLSIVRPATRRALLAIVTAFSTALIGVTAMPPGPAAADTAPRPGTPPTVSADPLPTWQVNGVVWSMTTVGNTVYATGSFTKARPPGTAEGSPQEVDRQNILAFDIRTGDLVTSFDHSLNGQGLRIVASPDGSRVYVGGEFTTVNGQPRPHIAAFNTATGALDPDFKPDVSNKVRAIVATDSTVYFGGNFFNVSGHWRTRLAAVEAADGGVLSWAPTADDDEVFAMALSPSGERVLVGGRFQQLNGTARVGIGAIDADTGALAPWSSDPVPARSGDNFSYVTDLHVAGDTVFASADGEGHHWFDGRFAAKAETGDLVWLDNCYGASYGIFAQGQSVYSVSHAHDCSSLGAFPETDPRTWHRALAETAYPTGTDQAPPGTNSNYSGQPVPSLLHWYPTLAMGRFTGQYQAAWAVTGTSDHIAMGGEFPRVNGENQQGLVRFAVKDKAPNQEGPRASDLGTPTAEGIPGGKVRVSATTTWDMDNENLTYELLRDGQSTPVAAEPEPSTFWDRPKVTLVDATAEPGSSHTYRVRAKDAFGNTVTSAASNSASPGGGTTSGPYSGLVTGDDPDSYWRLGETGGDAYDHAGNNDLDLGAGVTRGQAGAIDGDPDKAVRFNGSFLGTAASGETPAPGDFSIEAWVKTTSGDGGKIIGYGDSADGDSDSYDRHLYMTDDGRVVFGVYPGRIETIQSGAGLNDGQWHHLVGTLGSGDGMRLYVDGQQVAAKAGVTGGEDYTGHWRVGGDNLSGWPDRPSSDHLNGTIDEVAVYPRAIGAARVAEHHGVGTGSIAPNQPPTAAFTATCDWMECTFDASGSADADGSVAGYEWDFGDGRGGTGVTPSHTYSGAGDHTVKLTVTDDDGATGQITHTVTTSSQTLADDAFGRTVSGSFGAADTGGTWTGTGSSGALSVSGGAGHISLPEPRKSGGAYLGTVDSTGSDVSVRVSTDKEGTGNGVYFWLTGRRVDGQGTYRARVRLRPDGVVSLMLSRADTGQRETAIVGEQNVPGLTYTPGQKLRMRFQVTGSSPTTLKAKVWADGAAEPGWQVSGTDSTAGLQAAGGVGLRSYLAGNTTNDPFVVSVDDFHAVRVTG